MNQSTPPSNPVLNQPTFTSNLLSLTMAPQIVLRGDNAIAQSGHLLASLGKRPLLVGGNSTLNVIQPWLEPILREHNLESSAASYGNHCTESTLERLRQVVGETHADMVIGIGGGKALDTAKLLADYCTLPIVTIPTSAATCAAWTALSNIYSEAGGFRYDVPLKKCPDLLLLDYGLMQTAPAHMLVAGIGDALAKWYESSVSNGHSDQTLTIAAVQQARVLRDILFQQSLPALAELGGHPWRQVVDATVLLAGVIGGLGGAQCRTVAAHAVHNGLTHLPTTVSSPTSLHGEKVAYGILVQLRLEEMLQASQLAGAARLQLLKFYGEVGLPITLGDLGLDRVTVWDLHQAAAKTCAPGSDIHRLPFRVETSQLLAAMMSTTAPVEPMSRRVSEV